MTPFFIRGVGFKRLGISEAMTLSWRDMGTRQRRIDAIRKAKDDPLHRAIERERGSKRPRDERGRWV